MMKNRSLRVFPIGTVVTFLAVLALIPAARAATGSPDAFGYSFIDSAEVGLSYSFENISTTGSTTALGDDATVGLEYFRGDTLPPIGARPFALRFFPPLLVTNTSDSAAGSLRQAILILDTPSGGSVRFSAAVYGSTITLDSEIVIGKNLTIDTSSLADGITISGNNASTVFRIAPGSVATLSTLTITGRNGSGINNQSINQRLPGGAHLCDLLPSIGVSVFPNRVWRHSSRS
jgi:hypothetical protein